MPAQGWYEWNENELVRNDAGRKVKQPYFISLPDSDVMAFATLWAVWQGQDGLGSLLHSADQGSLIDHRPHPWPYARSPEAGTLQCLARPEDQWRDVQEIITDAVMDFSSYPVSTKVNIPT